MKRKIITAISIACLICLAYVLINSKISQYEGKTAHISIDDVEISMRNLANQYYTSIFDEPFFAFLQELHRDYGTRFSLYIYKEAKDYDIARFPYRFKSEFAENADWLKFGFHAIRPHFDESITSQIDSFSLYNQVDSCISAFAGEQSKTHILRLHYFYATPAERTLISHSGGVILLTADHSDRRSYSLSDMQLNVLRKGSCQDNELHYLATDLRIENMTIPDYDLRIHNENDTLAVFTHEWALASRLNKAKFIRTLQILKNNNITYIN